MPLTPWLFPVLWPVGLLAPGWLLGRALRTPAGPAGALLGSAVILMNLTLVLDACDLPLDLAHFAVGLALICAVLAGLARLRPALNQNHAVAAASATEPVRWTQAHWLLVPAGIGLVAIGWRAGVEPLAGSDAFFRWDFLAREMVRTGSLHFYPAVTPADFLHYSWCDGIAPLISTLYFWSYCSLGHVAEWATAPIIVAQAALLFWLVGHLAARHGGVNAGLAAIAVLALNAWLLWAIAMGQETGFTALGLVGMFYFLDRARTDPAARWPIWAGVAAGAGALAREYGLAFILLGFLTMAWQRTPRRGWIEFSIAAGAVALPWYLRDWVRTGNPLWSQSLGGLFPTNAVSAEYFRVVGEINDPLVHPFIFGVAAKLLALAFIPIALGTAGVIGGRREQVPWLAGIGVVAALWLWSIGQTSGGCAYSLRVLTPAFALGAVFAGCWLARRVARTATRMLGLAVLGTALAAEAAGRSFFLPFFPAVAWWNQPNGTWHYPAELAAEGHGSPNWQAIADSAEGRKILVSDPSCHAVLVERGAKPVPFFSPEVEFLFGLDLDFSACVARLRTLGFRFVLMTRHNDFNDRQTLRHAFFRDLLATTPAATTGSYFVYDLYPAAPRAAPPDAH